MDKRNSQRIRNILRGDITGKTVISVGYDKETIERKEGDVWEENGKKWTIKGGLKQTYSALSDLRESCMMPLFCPKCGDIMKKTQDRKSWYIMGVCFDCMIENDTQMMIAGGFEKYEKDIVDRNRIELIKETKDFLNEFASVAGSNHYVAENGDIEDWGLEQNQKNIESIVKKQLKKIKKIEGKLKNEKT